MNDVEATRKKLAKLIENDRANKSVRTKIADETGLTAKWIGFFATGHIKDPGVSKYQRLVEYLEANT